MIRNRFPATLVLAPCLLLLGAAGAPAGAQEQPVTFELPDPWGPFHPGVRTLLVTDSTREDLVSEAEGDFRPLLVRVWYPSDATAGDSRPYMDARTADAWRGTLPAPDGFEEYVVTHAIPDIPLSGARDRWPPAGGSTR